MTREKRLLTTILSGTIIVGGIITGFSNPNQTLTPQEANLLIDVYNYELKKINLNEINFDDDDFIYEINKRILTRTTTETEITISNLKFTRNDYLLLREALIKKSDKRSLIERIIK
ncbi:MAG: hypothetical protein N2Z85_01650 [Patescibacteria group bacterium]|nr:hypothetical protein [Patescibacteria group bacterium]